MTNILKKFRNNQFINKLIRSVLKELYNLSGYATDHWTPYGKIELSFNGIKFYTYSESDDYVAASLYYQKPILESQDINTFLSIAKNCKVILDIGANMGVYSILTAKVNPQASIYAFEPNEVNIRRLRKNIQINHLSNITLIEKAVGDRPGEIQFTVPAADVISDSCSALEDFSKSTYGGSIEWKNVTVNQIAIDDFIKQEDLKTVDLIKIDIEGYEMMAFKGAQECISIHKPIIQCEIFVDEARKQFFDQFMQHHSYKVYMLISEGLLRLDNGIQQQSGHNFIFMQHFFPDVLTPFNKAIELIYKGE